MTHHKDCPSPLTTLITEREQSFKTYFLVKGLDYHFVGEGGTTIDDFNRQTISLLLDTLEQEVEKLQKTTHFRSTCPEDGYCNDCQSKDAHNAALSVVCSLLSATREELK